MKTKLIKSIAITLAVLLLAEWSHDFCLSKSLLALIRKILNPNNPENT